MPTLEKIRVTGIDLAKFGNPFWRLTTYYWIQTKKAGVLSLIRPTLAQKKIIRGIATWLRLIILKARQMGVSTLLLLWHLDATMFTPNTTTVILAHERKALERLFKIIKIAYEHFPDEVMLANGDTWYKPQAKYDTKHELEFAEIGSRIYVALSVRSDTIHRLHVSEAAWLKNPEEQLLATLSAVPDDGVVTIETTANGPGGVFHEMWESSEPKDGVPVESPYLSLFLGFQEHEEYRRPLDMTIQEFEESLTKEEQEMHTRWKVPLAAIAWKRHRMRDKAISRKFKQEFPCNPREAFLHSGKSIFDGPSLDDWILLPPIESKMEGRLAYWVKAKKGRRYILGCDAASGRGEENLEIDDEAEGGTDYTVIQVYDCETLQLCAMFRAKWPYAKGHEVVAQMAHEYNDAYVVVEATDHGLTILNNLEVISQYPSQLIHGERTQDRTADRRTKKVGFYTNSKTKNLIIDAMAVNILEGNLRIHSGRVQSECYRFVRLDDGSMGAMSGYKDDCVMCCAFTTYPENVALALEVMRNTVVTKRDLKL